MFFALPVLARDEVHLTGRNCLIVILKPDCVGGGLGRACTVLWLPAGRMCECVSCELDQLSGRYLIYNSLRALAAGSRVADT